MLSTQALSELILDVICILLLVSCLGCLIVLLSRVFQGAATQVCVATSPKLDGVTGEYFADWNEFKHRDDSKDPENSKRLGEVSEDIVKNRLGRSSLDLLIYLIYSVS